MTTYISMLRGINVSGQKKIKMDELKKLYESLDFKNVQTYLHSGNVIFECSDTNVAKLINKIERKIKNSFGFDVLVLIRTITEIQKLIENTPFVKKDTSKLHVTFLSDTPTKSPINEINKIKDKSEEFFISGKEIYLFCPKGYGRTKLSNNFFERKLKLSATTRNWKTVNKLLEIAEQ
jgi:uncharacterized protein (DUF1697 family)